MGGWKLEASKMFLYLSIPVGTFALFNSPFFYEYALRRAMTMATADVDMDKVKQFERLNAQKNIDTLNSVIAEIDGPQAPRQQ